jgi:PAS domain S-box-containing protein
MGTVDEKSPSTISTALDVLPLRLAIVDETGTIVQTNERWDAFTAEHDDAVLTGGLGNDYLSALDAAEPDAADDVAAGVRSILSGSDQVVSVEYRLDDHGSRQWFLLRATGFEADAERYAAITSLDITDQKEISAELKLKERAMDEAPVGITISDPATEDNEIIYANDAFERITGYPVEEVLGRNCRFLQGADTSEESVATMRRAVENEEPVVVDVVNYRRNGEKFWNEVTIAPLRDEDGVLTHFVGFQRDITARKEAQLELGIERDRLALLNQVVRHDIRNDMAVILGWGEQIREQVPDQSREDLLRVLNTARHTKQLTESVADLVEILGEDDPSLSAVSLTETLREEIERARTTFAYRSDQVTITGDETLPEDLDVKATSLLSSVFGNLLNNAVFHNDKAQVEIDVSVEQRESTVLVRIADNGPGVSDSSKRSVFGRGQKGLESPGSGLGLYLVDNLVETYGGSVWIEDNDPEGAVFCVELQRA